MTFYFLDTSALVKRYHLEAGSANVAKILAEPHSTHLISRLGLVEAVSAFALKVREGQIPLADLPPIASGSWPTCENDRSTSFVSACPNSRKRTDSCKSKVVR